MIDFADEVRRHELAHSPDLAVKPEGAMVDDLDLVLAEEAVEEVRELGDVRCRHRNPVDAEMSEGLNERAGGGERLLRASRDHGVTDLALAPGSTDEASRRTRVCHCANAPGGQAARGEGERVGVGDFSDEIDVDGGVDVRGAGDEQIDVSGNPSPQF